jgi:hypothetical protein
MGPNPTGRTPSEPNTQGFNPDLERLREAGCSGEREFRLAYAIGELSNTAAEAVTMLEDPRVMDVLSFEERTRVAALRGRMEAACRSVS